eukprot:7022559-Prymnesium_polylepis.1
MPRRPLTATPQSQRRTTRRSCDGRRQRLPAAWPSQTRARPSWPPAAAGTGRPAPLPTTGSQPSSRASAAAGAPARLAAPAPAAPPSRRPHRPRR